ncbi:uncharacterized protein STEHIDRAFT_116901, partial [Stereum hirsutum FP-91666 SS1]|uniref:uncharacterized protein n=1 Tax=Stereum hirsutum (strain FP-91666) TaxID=721885 RepID=UPI000440E28F
MELSPYEILRLPRDVAVPLLAGMADELRALRQMNVSIAADHAGYEVTVAELKRERDDLKRQLSALLKKAEENLAVSVERVPTFGFVYADHRELEQRLQQKEDELAHLKTKIDAYEKKNERHEEVPSSHGNGPALITQGIERMQIDLDSAMLTDAVDDRSMAGPSKRHRPKKYRGQNQGKWRSAPEEGIKVFLQLRKSCRGGSSWPTYETVMPYAQTAEFVPPELPRSRKLLHLSGLSFVLGDDHNIANILLIEPDQRVDGSVRRDTTKRAVKLRQHKELLVQSNTQLWHYWGRYECISVSHLSTRSDILQAKLSPHQMEHLYEQSTLTPSGSSITPETKQKI